MTQFKRVDGAAMNFGILKSEAIDTNRGFNYQAYLTALAWAQIQNDEKLHIEVAEDFAVASSDEVVATQVKDVQSATLTLLHAREFLNNAAEMLAQPSNSQLTIVYHTTAKVGIEQKLAHRPNGQPGIEAWNAARNSGSVSDLIIVIDTLIAEDEINWLKLKCFRSNRTETQFKSDFIDRIIWAYAQPPSDPLETKLREQIATITFEEFQAPKIEGRTHADHVVQHVRHLSAEKDREKRQVTKADLRALLQSHCVVMVSKNVLAGLQQDSEKLKLLPIHEFDQKIAKRIEWLTKARFFPESEAENHARQLSKDVSDGGQFAVCSPQVRADALLLSTRVLLINAYEESKELLQRARPFDSTSENYACVEALVASKANQQAGLSMLSNKSGIAFNTYRFAIHNLADPMSALKWLHDAQFNATDFDADGNASVLHTMLKAEQWDQAVTWRTLLDAQLLTSSPALMYTCALVDLLSAVYSEDRARAISPPIFGETQYTHTQAGITARKSAAALFRTFSLDTRNLGLADTAQHAHEHALSIDLADIVSRDKAALEIKSLYEQEKLPQSFEWLPLFLQVAQLNNPHDVKDHLLRLWTRTGALQFYESRALFVLLQCVEPESWLDRLNEIRHALKPVITEEAIVRLFVIAHTKAGQIEAARTVIGDSNLEAISQEENATIVLDAKGFRTQSTLSETPILRSRRLYLHTLVAAGDRVEALKQLIIIFELTNYIADAEALLEMQIAKRDFQSVRDFFVAHPLFSLASEKLRGQQFDALYQLGKWSAAKAILRPLSSGETINPQVLKHLDVLSFDWEALEHRLRNVRAVNLDDPAALMQLAEQSQFLQDAKLTLSFVRRAVELDPTNADVCMRAYLYKNQFGVEHHAEAEQWIKTAIANPTETSSIRAFGLDEIAEQANEWRKQNSNINSGIANAELPLSIVAGANNSTLTKMYLETIEENLLQSEPHRRCVVPAFAGVDRNPMPVPTEVVLDASALLVLAKLDLLSLLPTCFQHVYVHHGLGDWLLSEVSQLPFHQPSKIKDARALQELLANGRLRVAKVTQFPPTALVDQVGNTLAQLIAAARQDLAENASAFVVHPGVIHRPGSLGRIPAEISIDAHLLVSMRPILDALISSGALSDEDSGSAIKYLSEHDKCWASEALLPTGSKLYLDEVAIAYLQWTGLLERLCQSELQVFVHPDKPRECEAYVKIQKINERQRATIDRLRTWLKAQTALGFVVALPQVAAESMSEQDSILALPDFFAGSARVPVVIFDDRAVNRYLTATHNDNSSSEVRTSLDVLEWLRTGGQLTEDQLRAKRMKLRQSGVMFVPFEADELYAAITKSNVVNGVLKESHDARTLREYALLAQSSGLFQTGIDYPWLSNLTSTAMLALRRLWEADEVGIATEIKSDWLIELSKIQVFNESVGVQFEESAVEQLKDSLLMRLLVEAWRPAKHKQRFIGWIDAHHFQRFKETRPNGFRLFCSWLKRLHLKRAVDIKSAYKRQVLHAMLGELPKTLFDLVSEDPDYVKAFSLEVRYSMTVSMKGAPEFDIATIYRATQTALESNAAFEVADKTGTSWKLVNTGAGSVHATEIGGTRNFEVINSGLFAPDVGVRKRALQNLFEAAGLDGAEAQLWRTLCDKAQFDHQDIYRLHQESELTPLTLSRKLRTKFASTYSWAALLVHSDGYFERLVGKWEVGETLAAFATRTADYGYGVTKAQKLKSALTRSIHTSLAPTLLTKEFSEDDLTLFVDEHLSSLDLWSLIGLLETLAIRAHAAPEHAEPCLEKVIQRFHHCVSDELHLSVSCSLAGFVAGNLNTSRRFHAQPPFWRRLAAFAHAAQIESALLKVRHGGLSQDDVHQLFRDNAQFKVSSIAEMRLEPRWGAFLLTAWQLQQELIGRALTALEPIRATVAAFNGDAIIFGDAESSLENRRQISFCYLPGPLEGAEREQSADVNPFDEVAKNFVIDQSRSLIHRFEHSVQIGLAGHLPLELQNLLIAVLRALTTSETTEEPTIGWPNLAIMTSLMAASSRNQELARLSIHYLKSVPSISFDLRAAVCLACCAWAGSITDWSKAIASCAWELFGTAENKSEASILLGIIELLCDVEPLLAPRVFRLVAKLKLLANQFGTSIPA
jgi:hypothetical protein